MPQANLDSMNTPDLAERSSFSRSFLIAFLLVLGGSALCLQQLPMNSMYLLGVDDAQIYFRYVRNILNGDGIVWNPGGERVEGFSSPLWLLVCLLTFSFSSYPEAALRIISLFSLAFSMAWLTAVLATVTLDYLGEHRPGKQLRLTALLAVMATATTVLDPNFLRWQCLSLMETALWSSLIIVLAGLLIRDTHKCRASGELHLILLLLVFCRPEGSAIAIVAAGLHALMLRYLNLSSGVLVVQSLPLLVTTMIAIIGSIGFRVVYFGYPFPNTYYAKVGDELFYNLFSGLRYFKQYFLYYPEAAAVFLIACIVVLGVLYRRSSMQGDHFSPSIAPITISALLLVLSGLYLYLGGDHFKQMRFLLPVHPLFGFLLVLFPLTWGYNRPRPIMNKVYGVFMVVIALIIGFSEHKRWRAIDVGIHEYRHAAIGRRIGALLDQEYRSLARPSVGVLIVGGFGYSYGGTVHDLLGLNSTVVAHATSSRRGTKNHAAFSTKAFYQLMPDLLLPNLEFCRSSTDQETLPESWAESKMRYINRFKPFKRHYTPVRIQPQGLEGSEIAICAYLRRSLVQHFTPHTSTTLLPTAELVSKEFEELYSEPISENDLSGAEPQELENTP